MTDTHNYSFFGQSTGLFLNSPFKSDPSVFITCIKKKHDGTWEKTSKGEGKKISLNLEEIVMILEVLKGKSESWNIYHQYQDEKTSIAIKWETEKRERLWINIGTYNKMLTFPQIVILRKLLKHILKEKIKFATIPKKEKKSDLSDKSNNKPTTPKEFFEKNPNENNLFVSEQVNSENETNNITGKIIRETEHALLIQHHGEEEIWTPKSIIRSQYQSNVKENQSFLIDTWFLKKNKIIN
ncbi:MAG: hypothetical protein ACFFA6_15115 [Promethearchaeota archaeon]